MIQFEERSAVQSKRGMVTSPHHLASQAGAEVLRAGGSAVDAAIATAAVLGVIYPHMTGMGGDAFWLIHDPLTGKVKWEIKLTDSVTQAGMLSTDGGLVFTGRMSGEFLAIDEASGKVLWQFQTGSGVNAPAVTYTHKGRQYVTVLSGIAGDSRGRRAAPRVPSGGSVWTFALLPD